MPTTPTKQVRILPVSKNQNGVCGPSNFCVIHGPTTPGHLNPGRLPGDEWLAAEIFWRGEAAASHVYPVYGLPAWSKERLIAATEAIGALPNANASYLRERSTDGGATWQPVGWAGDERQTPLCFAFCSGAQIEHEAWSRAAQGEAVVERDGDDAIVVRATNGARHAPGIWLRYRKVGDGLLTEDEAIAAVGEVYGAMPKAPARAIGLPLEANPWLYLQSFDRDESDAAIALSEAEYAALEPFFEDLRNAHYGRGWQCDAAKANPAAAERAADLLNDLQERDPVDLRRSEMARLGSDPALRVLWLETGF